MACYSHLRPNLGDTIVTTADLCYNVQYFEKHGRNLEDPWSCRQSVIYHKYDMAKNCSIWVTVQPPDTWESSLKDLCHHRLSHPLFMHLRFIRSAAANFRDYLNYISSKLLDLDQRVAFPKPLAEFDFDFALNQELHGLRGKLH